MSPVARVHPGFVFKIFRFLGLISTSGGSFGDVEGNPAVMKSLKEASPGWCL